MAALVQDLKSAGGVAGRSCVGRPRNRRRDILTTAGAPTSLQKFFNLK